MEIAVRVHTKLKELKDKTRKIEFRKPNYDRFFTFDTETRDDNLQSLTFGSFVVYKEDVLERIGLFYNSIEITERELKVLQNYCRKKSFVKLYELNEFIEKVFYPTTYDYQVPCTAFNLPFDITRLGVSHGKARGWMKGGFTIKLNNDKKYPPVRVKHLGAAESKVKFQSTSYNSFDGNFIDCQNIAAIMTDDKHISLKSACKRYNKKYFKNEVKGHGKINEKYIAYNINDTLATAELFTHLKNEYDTFGVSLPLTEVYSSASVGKAVLEDLGIMPFLNQNQKFTDKMLGNISQSYFGGRCEARIRKMPIEVCVLDCTSMYPTLFMLLGLYDFLIAERIDHKDDTESVQKLIDTITIENLQNPDMWKRLNVIVELEPDDDLLPVRAKYNEKEENFTVGLNYLTSKRPLYYMLPSVILSKLETSKIPKIKKAIRFIPIGKQKTLKKAKILGMDIDPRTDNIFKILVEKKQESKIAKDGRDRMIKILVNATSYGIYFQLDKEDKKSDIIVYSGNEKFEDHKYFEKAGKYYHPILASMITDGSKLLLGLGDCILKKHNEVVTYCDTDSMFIPPKYKDEIVEFFEPLNPYRNVQHLFKIEVEKILVYIISAKRYALYNRDSKVKITIKDTENDEDYSLHGLGHLLNPFNKDVKRWQKEVWLDILKLQYKDITEPEFFNKYRGFYAISQFKISTTNLMDRFGRLNKDKNYNGSFKPFNFMLIGFSNDKDIKPISPYSKDPQSMPYGEFVDYKSGKVMQGQHYFKNLADELASYINHPESKLDGDIGLLQRRRITADKIIYIGKEANNLEEQQSGLNKESSNIYHNPKDIKKLLSLKWGDIRDKKIISKMHFYRLKRQLKKGMIPKLRSSTLRKVLNNLTIYR